MSGTIVNLIETALIAMVAVAIVVWLFSRPGRARTGVGRVALVAIVRLLARSLIGGHRTVASIDGALRIDGQLR